MSRLQAPENGSTSNAESMDPENIIMTETKKGGHREPHKRKILNSVNTNSELDTIVNNENLTKTGSPILVSEVGSIVKGECGVEEDQDKNKEEQNESQVDTSAEEKFIQINDVTNCSVKVHVTLNGKQSMENLEESSNVSVYTSDLDPDLPESDQTKYEKLQVPVNKTPEPVDEQSVEISSTIDTEGTLETKQNPQMPSKASEKNDFKSSNVPDVTPTTTATPVLASPVSAATPNVRNKPGDKEDKTETNVPSTDVKNVKRPAKTGYSENNRSEVKPYDLVLKKSFNVAQIIFSTHKARQPHTFTRKMMTKLVEILKGLIVDKKCNCVLILSDGPNFCHGVDFTALTHRVIERRRQVAHNLAKATKDYLYTLLTFPKPIIAGVRGSNVGLGVTQLSLFDVVIGTTKATYEAPYAKIGQLPEGYCIWNNLPKIRRNFRTKLFFNCDKLHSAEALLSGLVSKFSSTNDLNEVALEQAKKIAAFSPEVSTAMKRTVVLNNLKAVGTQLDAEFDTIIDQWCSDKCFESFRRYIETGHF
ncbi:testis-specific chromodomain protein Y 1-like [Teleopsis dalmanni]|uniref:testis-specific chromodomain protein Y 1-like n=1 Tax=Teleopsis dalmanni TaxID=139649 RepID=UPI0018CCA890|nr:testis-specific chromodomain protein Y 1-like [Teleopsis dalmanni]